MARSVSVKIPTAKVIEMVEAKIAQMKQEDKDYPKLLENYEKEMNSILTKVIKIAKDNSVTDKVSVHNNYSGISISLSKSLIGDIEFPKQPTDPSVYYRQNKFEELEKTLKLLRLTEQESVTSSTYNSVLDLL